MYISRDSKQHPHSSHIHRRYSDKIDFNPYGCLLYLRDVNEKWVPSFKRFFYCSNEPNSFPSENYKQINTMTQILMKMARKFIEIIQYIRRNVVEVADGKGCVALDTSFPGSHIHRIDVQWYDLLTSLLVNCYGIMINSIPVTLKEHPFICSFRSPFLALSLFLIQSRSGPYLKTLFIMLS